MDKNILSKKKVIKDLCLKYDILYFAIFGSRITNNYKNNSDYDFAFYSNKKINQNELQNDLEILFSDSPVDLVNLNVQDDPILANQILTNGITLFSISEEIEEELSFRAWADYIEIKPLIDEVRNNLMKI